MRATFFVIAFALLASCSPGPGEDLGIKFSRIPAGTEYYYEDKRQRLTWMTRYEGIEGGKHVMRKYFLNRKTGRYDRLIQTSHYDTAGRRTRIDDKSFDFTFVYAPFDCLNGFPGACSHRIAVFDSKTGARRSLQTKHYELRRQGNVLRVVENAKGNRLQERITLDEANMVVAFSEPKSTFSQEYRLVRTVAP